ncbi:DUF952 domain-containing protein [Hirschia baltica]|uniref:DUF952 domain-containing protein n=1 Tax=Hirschia baltica (strain ATCC 49814 / DSM 5838 / IFAM 1418) TaxID=582402 RepID=C6XQ79_HIRBI|nr:DUF952 domain-containing protein [Hirschia baltica]ACT58596.1 protein of unknown function DUF952 [Hirschia baltica ATCC 49814]
MIVGQNVIMENRLLFKILDATAWQAAIAGELVQAPVDIADGYVHFSTAFQVQETLDKWFQGEEEAVLIAFDANAFGDQLKWEVSRGNDKFPHVYGEVRANQAIKVWYMDIGPSGAPQAPDDALKFELPE